MTKRGRLRIKLKRAYDPPDGSDGRRILVDRVWPRGLSKDRLRLDSWHKEAAPSAGLRKWFNHEPEKWDAFRDRYFRELDQQPEVVAKLLADCGEGTVTLVFGATETRYNNAVALKAYLERRGKKIER